LCATPAVLMGLRVLLFAHAVISLAADPIDTCDKQNKCMAWTVEQVATKCSVPATPCDFHVCLKLEALQGCLKKATETISHTCEGDIAICNPGMSTAETKGIRMPYAECQYGKPGTTLTFIVKDGNGCAALTGTRTLALGATASCRPTTTSDSSCTGKGNVGKECLWTVQLPQCAPRPCADGEYWDGTSCKSDCICDGGYPSTSSCNGEHDCDQCFAGYHPVTVDDGNTKCPANCICEHGTPRKADDCDGDHWCTDCDKGYDLISDRCVPGTKEDCICEHGKPRKADECDGDHWCTDCNKGYDLISDRCVPGTKESCTCRHGTAMDEHDCHGEEKCRECDDGYSLDSDTLLCVKDGAGSMPDSISDADRTAFDNMQGGLRLHGDSGPVLMYTSRIRAWCLPSLTIGLLGLGLLQIRFVLRKWTRSSSTEEQRLLRA